MRIGTYTHAGTRMDIAIKILTPHGKVLIRITMITEPANYATEWARFNVRELVHDPTPFSARYSSMMDSQS